MGNLVVLAGLLHALTVTDVFAQHELVEAEKEALRGKLATVRFWEPLKDPAQGASYKKAEALFRAAPPTADLSRVAGRWLLVVLAAGPADWLNIRHVADGGPSQYRPDGILESGRRTTLHLGDQARAEGPWPLAGGGPTAVKTADGMLRFTLNIGARNSQTDAEVLQNRMAPSRPYDGFSRSMALWSEGSRALEHECKLLRRNELLCRVESVVGYPKATGSIVERQYRGFVRLAAPR